MRLCLLVFKKKRMKLFLSFVACLVHSLSLAALIWERGWEVEGSDLPKWMNEKQTCTEWYTILLLLESKSMTLRENWKRQKYHAKLILVAMFFLSIYLSISGEESSRCNKNQIGLWHHNEFELGSRNYELSRTNNEPLSLTSYRVTTAVLLQGWFWH